MSFAHPAAFHLRSPRGALESIVLPAKLREDLRSLGREHEATLFMLLLSAFYILLFRYTNQEDFAVGLPIASAANLGEGRSTRTENARCDSDAFSTQPAPAA